MFVLTILIATIFWFILAGILYFNPIIDKVYRSEDKKPGVRVLPMSAKTMGKVFLVVLLQVICFASVFVLIKSALPEAGLIRGLIFGFIIVLTKIIPRDTDRILVSTYPTKRLTIEFFIGIIASFVVGIVFGYML